MPEIQVKQAIRIAMDYIKSVFDGVEHVEGFRLEEVERDEDERCWLITVSLLREPTEEDQRVFDEAHAGSLQKLLDAELALKAGFLGSESSQQMLKRVYRVIQLDSDTGEVKSIKIRALV